MKKLCVAILTISLLFGGIVSASNHNQTIRNIWDSRPDLQVAFPNGFSNGDWTIIDWAERYGWKENHHLKQFNQEYEKDYIYRKYLPLERALDKIASKQYDYDDYFCVQFTEDLEEKLIEKDIASVKIIGRTPYPINEGDRHEWIAIMFEPITGEIIKVSDEYVIERIVD